MDVLNRYNRGLISYLRFLGNKKQPAFISCEMNGVVLNRLV